MAANPEAGEVLVEVRAGSFILSLDFGALVALEGIHKGKSFGEILSDALPENGTPTAQILVDVIWAALQKHHNLSREEVSRLLNLAEFRKWADGIAAVAMISGPPADKTTPARPPRAKRGTGRRS